MGPVHGWDCAGADAVERRAGIIKMGLRGRNISRFQRH
jgi:hypothetical protein